MKLLHASIFTLFCTYVQANTVNSYITDNYLQNLNEDNSLSINQNNTSGYFIKHSISQVYSDNPYLYTPSFTTGILDNGFYDNHEDMHRFLNMLTAENKAHGTSLLSLSFGSKLDNTLGTLGIVNSFSSLQNKPRLLTITDQIDTINTNKIISSSYDLYPNTSIKGKGIGATYTVAEEVLHVEAFVDLRKEIKLNPNNLYVFAAGNSGTHAKWNNGAIHYKVVKNSNGIDVIKRDEIKNVIVVGAMGYDDVLHYYSDFGESVDVATISGVYASKSVINGVSSYTETVAGANGIVPDYGVRRIPTDENNGDFHGSSAAQPITAGIAALLLSMDPSLTGAQLKKFLLHEQLTSKVNTRYTGTETCVNNFCTPNTEVLPNEIAVINLFNSYDALKTILQNHANEDVLLLNDKSIVIDADQSCKTLWEDNITDHSVSLSSENDATKNYTAYRYDDKCLFFRGNSFIIEYDSATQVAQSLYYGDNNYETYALFRKFTENLASAKSDNTWRDGYEVGVNTNGFVGCAISDNCIDNVISTTTHCENLFEALTGTGSSTMNSTVSVPEEDVCLFEENTINTRLYYYAESGEILFEEKVVEIIPEGNYFLQNPILDIYTVQQGNSIIARIEQWYEGNQTDAELSNVRVGYYLSTDEIFSNDDILLNSDSSSLGSDDTNNNESAPLIIPASTTAGDYYILFVSDYENNFVETNENDNILASQFTVTEEIKNELYIANTSITAQSGTSISVSSRYYYSGNQTSSQLGTAYLGYYLSTDRYLSSDDVLLDSDSSSIGTNDLYDSESETLDLPSDLDSGNYYILFIADHINSISETNENNNVSYESFSYTGGNTQNTDDIYITNMSVTKRSGNIYRAYLHQRYSGNTTNADLNNPDIIYVFSKDSILDINDVAIGRDSSTIGSDDTYDSEYIDFDITDYTTNSGTYYILFYVDYNKEVIEINENNNSGKVSFSVN